MTTALPEPPIAAAADLRAYDWFPLQHKRLKRSSWWLAASDLARSRSIDLWCEAYEQVPAGSLPSNDAELAIYAGFGRDIPGFLAAKPELMAPWVLCSDGRYYHPVLCEIANTAWALREESRVKEREKKRKQRAKATPVPAPADESPGDEASPDGDVPVAATHVPGAFSPQDKTEQDTTEEVTADAVRPQLALVPLDEGPRPKARFDDGWKAFPKKGRERSGKDVARPVWMRAAKGVGGEDELVECIKRYAVSSKALEDGGEFVPGFHRWLKMGMAVNWTADAVAEGVSDGQQRTGARRGDGQRLNRLRSFDTSVSGRADDF